jgi:5-formyltetrahydrofolate cyclo-ligase
MASAEIVSPLNEKRSLRRAMSDRRTQHPLPERQRAARAAAERLLDLPELAEVTARRGCLAGFVAVRAELDPVAALDEARRRGARIAYPRVADDRTPRLRFHLAQQADLTPGRFGIPEPSPGLPEVAAGEIDLMLVPGLAFDAAGHRLGTGGGYYDEWLEQAGGVRPHVVGVAYDFQVVATCPTEPRDQTMDGVVTDARVLRAGAGGER